MSCVAPGTIHPNSPVGKFIQQLLNSNVFKLNKSTKQDLQDIIKKPKNRLKFMRILLATILICIFVSCNQNNVNGIFFERSMSKVFVCDTIFDNSLRDKKRIIKIYEQSDGNTVIYNGLEYRRYRVSINEDSPWMLLRSNDNKIYMISEDVIRHRERYEEELLIDWGLKTGASWTIVQGDVLGNSIFKIDSIDRASRRYFLSAKSDYNIADRTQVVKLILSQENGIDELSIVTLGDSVNCRCLK